MKLIHAARTDVGMIRSGNEDNFTVDSTATRGIFIVADGMGGHAAGEVASEMAVDIVQKELVGVRDLELGEEVAAFVTLRPGVAAEPEELIAHCRQRLAAFKYPRRLSVLDALPRSTTGKILKSRLSSS